MSKLASFRQKNTLPTTLYKISDKKRKPKTKNLYLIHSNKSFECSVLSERAPGANRSPVEDNPSDKPVMRIMVYTKNINGNSIKVIDMDNYDSIEEFFTEAYSAIARLDMKINGIREGVASDDISLMTRQRVNDLDKDSTDFIDKLEQIYKDDRSVLDFDTWILQFDLGESWYGV